MAKQYIVHGETPEGYMIGYMTLCDWQKGLTVAYWIIPGTLVLD